MLFALAACGITKLAVDTDTGPVEDTDIEVVDTDDTDDTDDTPVDTAFTETGYGYGYLLLVGYVETSQQEFVSFDYGYVVWGAVQESSVCSLIGAVQSASPAPDGCPGCEWSFDFGAMDDSLAEGDACADFGWYDGVLDGADAGSWGFAAYTDWEYEGVIYRLDDVMFGYSDYGWTPWIFNYGGSDYVTGDASSLSFWAWASNEYYYYYY